MCQIFCYLQVLVSFLALISQLGLLRVNGCGTATTPASPTQQRINAGVGYSRVTTTTPSGNSPPGSNSPNSPPGSCTIPVWAAGGSSYPGCLFGIVSGGPLQYISEYASSATTYPAGTQISTLECYAGDAPSGGPTTPDVYMSGTDVTGADNNAPLTPIKCTNGQWIGSDAATVITFNSDLTCETAQTIFQFDSYSSTMAGSYGDSTGANCVPLALLDGLSLQGSGNKIYLYCDSTCNSMSPQPAIGTSSFTITSPSAVSFNKVQGAPPSGGTPQITLTGGTPASKTVAYTPLLSASCT